MALSNERRGSRLSDDKHRLGEDRRACRQAIERVLDECVDKVGFEPHNLVYLSLKLEPSKRSAGGSHPHVEGVLRVGVPRGQSDQGGNQADAWPQGGAQRYLR